MSRRAVLRADFLEKSGPPFSGRASRRKRTRHTRWRVHSAACNCTAITAARSRTVGVTGRCHYRIALARNRPNRHVPAKLARGVGRLPFYDRADKRAARLISPDLFNGDGGGDARRLWDGDGADWNSRRRRSYNEVY